VNSNDIIYTVVFSTLAILLLIAGVAIVIFISNKQRITQEMKIAQMELDYEKELRTVQHEVQEHVLTNVGRELHDNIGQLLTVMHWQLEQKKVMAPEMSATLEPLHETLRNTTQQVKLLGRTLNSEMLEQNGLLNTIQMEVTRLQQLTHFTLHWTKDDTEPQLAPDQRLMVFRIFQEVLNNTMKHAKAKNITISICGKQNFLLQVQDDGKGFDMDEKMRSGTGAGLKNIMKRAALANLDCTIVAQEGKGCIFTLKQQVTQTS
jgi:signal transduction histidine kinase